MSDRSKHVEAAVRQGGSILAAAEILGVSVRTVHRWLRADPDLDRRVTRIPRVFRRPPGRPRKTPQDDLEGTSPSPDASDAS